MLWLTHARIQEFLPGWSRPDCQKTALTTFLSFFCPQLLQFYSGLSMVYFKEINNFTRFQGGGGGGGGGGGPTYSKGSNFFHGGGGGGPNAYSRNP